MDNSKIISGKPINKRILYIAIFLYLWPIILLSVTLPFVYTFVENNQIDQSTALAMFNLAKVVIVVSLYGGLVSVCVATYLLMKRLRR